MNLPSFTVALLLAAIGILLYLLLATDPFVPGPPLPFNTGRQPSQLELSITPPVN